MDGSIVFARWRQCALPWGHIGATWQIQLNLCFLRPTRVHNPNGKSIGLAIFAQLTAESPYTLQCTPLSPKWPLFTGDLKPQPTHDSMSPSKPINQTASWSVQPFLHRRLQSVPILYNMMLLLPSKLPLAIRRWGPQSNTWFLGPTRVLNPNGISIASAIFACLWNQLANSLRQPHSSPSVSHFPADAPATSSYSLNLPPSPSITPSLFHSRLKTYLFHKSFPP